MRRSSAPVRRAIPLLFASFVLSSCDDGTGRGFAQGRACRIGERMVAALAVGDTVAADDEVERLDDLDGSDDRFELDEIADVVDSNDDDAVDELVDLFDDGDCDIDEPTRSTGAPPATTTTTPPATSVTAPTTRDTTPFTLPIPTATTTEGSSSTTAPTSSQPPPTNASTTTDGPSTPSPLGTIEVDVGAIVSSTLPEGTRRPPRVVAEEFELEGMIVPASPAIVTTSYVTRGLTYGSTYDSITSVADTDVPLSTIDARFRTAIARTGEYRYRLLGSPGNPDSVGFRAETEAGDGPAWEVELVRSADDGLVEVRVARSDLGQDVSRAVPPTTATMLLDQLAVVGELGWTPESVTELRSETGTVFATATLGVTVRAAEPRALADELALRVEDATIADRPNEVRVETPDGTWQFSEVGESDVFVHFTTA